MEQDCIRHPVKENPILKTDSLSLWVLKEIGPVVVVKKDPVPEDMFPGGTIDEDEMFHWSITITFKHECITCTLTHYCDTDESADTYHDALTEERLRLLITNSIGEDDGMSDVRGDQKGEGSTEETEGSS